MSTALKIGLSGLGIIVTAGGGLIGSNYAIEKTIQKDLPQDAGDAAWDKKLEILLEKMKTNPQITSKIDSNAKTIFALKDNGERAFKEQETARTTLKGWCEQGFKDVDVKDDEELCKFPKQVGWLFGDQRK